jgi:hypothetical protein
VCDFPLSIIIFLYFYFSTLLSSSSSSSSYFPACRASWCPAGLERSLAALDALPERDTHAVWLVFARDRRAPAAAPDHAEASRLAAPTARPLAPPPKRSGCAWGLSHAPLPPIDVAGRDGAWWASTQSFPTANGGGDASEHAAAAAAAQAAARAAGAAAAQADLPPDWHAFLGGAADDALGSGGKRECALGSARSGSGLGQALDPARHRGPNARTHSHSHAHALFQSTARLRYSTGLCGPRPSV